jgi:transposase InsO family protein
MEASQFLCHLKERLPYAIRIVLTDNGVQFTHRKQDKYAVEHVFERVCRQFSIEHRLTQVKHPWMNGQVERMNRTIKEATVKRYHYDSRQQLENHLHDFIQAYNFARRLKTLHGLTPYEYLCKIWTTEPERFIFNPIQQMMGLNTIDVAHLAGLPPPDLNPDELVWIHNIKQTALPALP